MDYDKNTTTEDDYIVDEHNNDNDGKEMQDEKMISVLYFPGH